MKGGICVCSICHHSPCLRGCPNAPDPEPSIRCFKCGCLIAPGSKYWEDVLGNICETCMESIPADEMEEYGDCKIAY